MKKKIEELTELEKMDILRCAEIISNYSSADIYTYFGEYGTRAIDAIKSSYLDNDKKETFVCLNEKHPDADIDTIIEKYWRTRLSKITAKNLISPIPRSNIRFFNEGCRYIVAKAILRDDTGLYFEKKIGDYAKSEPDKYSLFGGKVTWPESNNGEIYDPTLSKCIKDSLFRELEEEVDSTQIQKIIDDYRSGISMCDFPMFVLHLNENPLSKHAVCLIFDIKISGTLFINAKESKSNVVRFNYEEIPKIIMGSTLFTLSFEQNTELKKDVARAIIESLDMNSF